MDYEYDDTELERIEFDENHSNDAITIEYKFYYRGSGFNQRDLSALDKKLKRLNSKLNNTLDIKEVNTGAYYNIWIEWKLLYISVNAYMDVFIECMDNKYELFKQFTSIIKKQWQQ